MAEAILNREGHGKFRAFSAGSHPKGKVHPHTLDLLRRMNFDTSKMRSKSWTEFTGPDVPKLDFVFTVCDQAAAEACPVWPERSLMSRSSACAKKSCSTLKHMGIWQHAFSER